MPAKMVDSWCGVVGVRRERLEVRRQRSVRKEIVYEVEEYWKGGKDMKLKELVERKRLKFGKGWKVMVFVRRVDRVKEVMQLLGCKGYWSEAGSVREKRKIMEEFFDGEEDVIVGTNAVGLGIDNEKVRCVIHEEMRGGMMEFGQESGRGGRVRGLRSESVVMREVWKQEGKMVKFTIKLREGNVEEEKMIERYLSGDECRRKSLDEWLDGDIRVGGCKAKEGEEECDVCRMEVVRVKMKEERKRERVESGVGLREDEKERRLKIQEENKDKLLDLLNKSRGKREEMVRKKEEVVMEEKVKKEERMKKWRVELRLKKEEEDKRIRKIEEMGNGGVRGRENRRVKKFGKMMNEWRYGTGRCWICVGRGSGWKSEEHEWKDCDEKIGGELVVARMMRVIEEMKMVGLVGKGHDLTGGWRKNSGCWFCGLMKETCGRWKQGVNGRMTKSGGVGGCGYEMEEVLGMVVFVLEIGGKEDEREAMRKFVETRMRDEGVRDMYGKEVYEGIEEEVRNGERWMSRKMMWWLWRKRMWCIEGRGLVGGEEEEDEDDERFVKDWGGKAQKDANWRIWDGGIETNNICEVLWRYGSRRLS